MRALISSILFIILCFTFTDSVYTQEEPVVRIKSFGGLNTSQNPNTVKVGEASTAHNIDYSKVPGALSNRYGTRVVRTYSDSVTDLYGAYYNDGTQQLFVAYDLDTFKTLAITDKGGVTGSTVLTNYLATSADLKFTMLNDNVYIANGVQKSLVYDGNSLRYMTPLAPGEPSIIPFDSAGSKLSGLYRYTISYLNAGTKNRTGYISQPVKVENGYAKLKDFQYLRGDSVDATIFPCSLLIYRTKANPGALRINTYAYLIDADTIILADTSTSISLIYTDTSSDAELSTTDSVQLVITETNNDDILRRYGGVGMILRDTGAALTDTTLGVWQGLADTTIVGWGYYVTFIDTLTGAESDTSRGMYIKDEEKYYNYYTIAIPPPPNNSTHLAVNVYRAALRNHTWDSVYFSYDLDGIWIPDFELPAGRWIRWGDSTFAGTPRLIEQISTADTSYTDSVGWDVARVGRSYRMTTPPLLDDIFSFESRLYGISGSNIYFSHLDTAYKWGVFDAISINRSDGDRITRAFPARGIIRVLKNSSSYNIFQDANLAWNRVEISNDFGCIAPNSYASGLGGHYYLSHFGVIRETEGDELERKRNFEVISKKLDNFDKLSLSQKQSAYGVFHDNKYMLTIGDTNYVYDEVTSNWSTWSLPIHTATKYSSETSLEYLPPDSLYLVKDTNRTIMRYAPEGQLAHSDSSVSNFYGKIVPLLWVSHDLFIDEKLYNIDKIGLWTKDINQDTIQIRVGIANENDTTLWVQRDYSVDSISASTKFNWFPFNVDQIAGDGAVDMTYWVSPSVVWRVKILTYSSYTDGKGQEVLVKTDLPITGMDIWYNMLGIKNIFEGANFTPVDTAV